ncbi:unnamed protein product, partial [Prorocentrum cordatum]
MLTGLDAAVAGRVAEAARVLRRGCGRKPFADRSSRLPRSPCDLQGRARAAYQRHARGRLRAGGAGRAAGGAGGGTGR